MKYIPRRLAPELAKAARSFPALILTGPRRAGKTTLLRHAFPGASYRLLEDPEIVARIRADPSSFLGELRLPAILDEIQNVPEILGHVRARVDAAPKRMGQWLLTGSQEAPLMRGVTESMAGRAAVLELFPLSTLESPRVTVVGGGFPEALARPRAASLWYRSYLQTYLERDVRALTAVRDLATFRRFLGLLAARTGQILNMTAIAAPLGVSVPTVGDWLGILETTGQIALVLPYFENFGKRLVKSPKIHFLDSGLVCHLLSVESEAMLRRSPFAGAIWEGFVASEILKEQVNRGRRRELYYFRDQQGLEVDLLAPAGPGKLALIEVKASASVHPGDARPIARLRASMGSRAARGYVVHWPTHGGPSLRAVAKGTEAVTVAELVETLCGVRKVNATT